MDRMERGGPLWNRIAAATGIDYFLVVVALMVIAQVKDFENVSDFLSASNEVWGASMLLLGFAAVFFLWFTSIFVARLRQVEAAAGTSGRLGNAVLAAGAVISGGFLVAITAQWAARQLGASEVGELSTAILEGPPLAFAIAVYIGAAGLTVVRAGAGVGSQSRVVALLSLLIAPAYLALAGIQLFNNYAWIDETGSLLLAVWVLAVSVIGVQRWGAIDDGYVPGATVAPTPAVIAPEPLEVEDTDDITATTPAPRKKPAARKKTAPRKAPARKKAAPRRKA